MKNLRIVAVGHTDKNLVSTRSRALYERFGFEVTAELRALDGPPLWAMWREPRR